MPSTNEIHVWKAKGRVTVDLGINYFRRRARELGGLLWDYEPRIMTDREYREYGVNAEVQIGAICRGFRSSDLKELIGLGVPPELAFEEASKRKARIGIGVVNRNAEPKKGRPLSWTALKGAEKDLARALFPNLEQADEDMRAAILEAVPNVEPGDDEWDGPTLTGEEAEELAKAKAAHARTMAEWEVLDDEEKAAKTARNSELLYGPPDFEGFDDEPTTSTNGPVVINVEPDLPAGEEALAAEVQAITEELQARHEKAVEERGVPEEEEKIEPEVQRLADAVENGDLQVWDGPPPELEAELEEEEEDPDPATEDHSVVNLALEPEIIRRASRKLALWLKREHEDMSDAVRQDVEPVNAPIRCDVEKDTLKAVQTTLSKVVPGRKAADKDDNRRKVLLYLFGVDSGNKLTELEGQAIIRWSQAMGGEHFKAEVKAILDVVQEEAGQGTLPGM